jgi:hypothetical protein
VHSLRKTKAWKDQIVGLMIIVIEVWYFGFNQNQINAYITTIAAQLSYGRELYSEQTPPPNQLSLIAPHQVIRTSNAAYNDLCLPDRVVSKSPSPITLHPGSPLQSYIHTRLPELPLDGLEIAPDVCSLLYDIDSMISDSML